MVVTDVASPAFYQPDSTAAAYCSVCATYARDGKRLTSAQDVLDYQRKAGIGGFADVVPPLGAIIADGDSVIGITDACGLQHLYYTQSDDFAAISTSSSALAEVVNANFDLDGLAVFTQVGHLIGSLSFFEKIRKVAYGNWCEIRDGEVSVHSYADASRNALGSPFRRDEDSISEGTDVVRDCVQTALAAFPDAHVEVSGGIDSRLILSAIPRAQRRELLGVTIGRPTDPDYQIARRLAEDSGFRHELTHLDALSDFTDEQVLSLLRSAARWCDYSSALFPRAMIEFASREIGYGPRMGGANGEFARGFYYPAQPKNAGVSATLIDRLIDWRICVNSAVSPGIYRAEFRDSLRDRTRRHIHQEFREEPGDWLPATDEFYLHQRMQRWAGSAVSAMSSRRAVLGPFFDPRFIDWARRVSPELKRGSSAFARIIEHLDSDLAAIPLDSGRSPRAVNDASVSAMLSRLGTAMNKTVAKVVQKVIGKKASHPTDQILCDRLLSAVPEEELLPHVMALEFIDPDGVRNVLRQPARNQSSTIGFLLSLNWIVEARDH